MRTARRFATILVLLCMAVTARGQSSQITADSPPYHFEWDGAKGTLSHRADGNGIERRMPVAFLRSDPGPQGYAKSLVWFLARDEKGFALLWGYLDESGSDFWGWLYEYPNDRMSAQHFMGAYRFAPPAGPYAPSPLDSLKLDAPPAYSGPDFAFADWTRKGGNLPGLALSASNGVAPARSLSALTVAPLHELDVAAENGWRSGGWQELHALARDAASDPYYLILYSNTDKGFVVDLKRAQAFVTDFGSKVTFAGASDAMQQPSESIPTRTPPTAPRYLMLERAFSTSRAHPNSAGVSFFAEFIAPDGRRFFVPGFWDGGGTWRLRFVPNEVGSWSRRTHSSDPELDGRTETFNCVSEGAGRGFLRADPDHPDRFALQDGTGFWPSFSQSVSLVGMGADDAAFSKFQRDIDRLADNGVNRLVGTRLFADGAFNIANPAFLQQLDRRIAYCNAKGLVPDIGLGLTEAQLKDPTVRGKAREAWRTVVARYAAYNVCWNLFDADNAYAPEFALLTKETDPYKHLITTMVSQPNPGKSPPPFADATWLDVITIRLASPPALAGVETTADRKFNKPVVVAGEKTAGMWATWLSGGYAMDEDALASQLFRRTRFNRLEPHPDALSDSESAMLLADVGWEYIVYFPEGGKATLDLLEATGALKYFWFHTTDGKDGPTGTMDGGAKISISSPLGTGWVFLISRR